MRESQNPIAIRSQDMIYAAFVELLLQIPYKDISVGALCKTADIDRRTFYRHFEHKNDVLHSYLDKIFDEYMQQVAELASNNSVDYLKLFFRFFSENHRDFLSALHHSGSLAMAFMERGRVYMLLAIV